MFPASLRPRYRPLKKLGAGAMGAVFLAQDTRLSRPVAIKVALRQADARFLKRFRREARALAQIEHAGIVRVYDFGDEDGRVHIILESLDGEDLWRAPGETPLADVLGVADALEALHSQRTLHRDVKPENLIRTEDGRVVLIDFGLSQGPRDTRLTETGHVVGTPYYMAPEVLYGELATEASDFYSLGATLFAMAEGRRPFDPDAFSAWIAGGPLNLPWDRVDPDDPIRRIVTTCMDREPARRPTSRRQLEELRDRVAGATEVLPTPGDSGASVVALPPVGSRSGTPPAGARAGGAAGTRRVGVGVVAVAVALAAAAAVITAGLRRAPMGDVATASGPPPAERVALEEALAAAARSGDALASFLGDPALPPDYHPNEKDDDFVWRRWDTFSDVRYPSKLTRFFRDVEAVYRAAGAAGPRALGRADFRRFEDRVVRRLGWWVAGSVFGYQNSIHAAFIGGLTNPERRDLALGAQPRMNELVAALQAVGRRLTALRVAWAGPPPPSLAALELVVAACGLTEDTGDTARALAARLAQADPPERLLIGDALAVFVSHQLMIEEYVTCETMRAVAGAAWRAFATPDPRVPAAARARMLALRVTEELQLARACGDDLAAAVARVEGALTELEAAARLHRRVVARHVDRAVRLPDFGVVTWQPMPAEFAPALARLRALSHRR